MSDRCPYVGESMPFVLPVTDARTGEPITDPAEVRVWVTRPDGSVLGDKRISEGAVANLGGGRYQATFTPDVKGIHVARSMVRGPDGMEKESLLRIEVCAF